ncbi:hypothetical protein WA158_002370 [Blastocystis sp. Blastoise]
MPLTPKFSISQDDEYVILEIHVPWVKVSNMEFVIDGQDFSFWCQPYLLKLHFPFSCVDDERAKAAYDLENENGTMIVHVPKENKEQYFPDLDLFSRLLPPTKINRVKGELISEVKDIENEVEDFLKKENVLLDKQELNKKSLESSENASDKKKIIINKDLLNIEQDISSDSLENTQYGFNNEFHSVFTALYDDLSDFTSLPDPEHMTEQERNSIREEEEIRSFDPDIIIINHIILFIYTNNTEPITRYYIIPVDSPDNDTIPENENTIPKASISNKDIHSIISVNTPIDKSTITNVSNNNNNNNNNINNTTISEQDQKPSKKPLITVIEENGEPCSSEVLQEPKHNSNTISTTTVTPIESYIQKTIPLPALPSNENKEETSETCSFTSDEKKKLSQIKPVSVQMNEKDIDRHVRMLSEILLAYIYDTRFTQSDPSVESNWTIYILSPTLCYLSPCESLKSSLLTFIKRVCIYPYIRKYAFAKLCIKDLICIYKLGRRRILKCLLEIQNIFEHSDSKYIYNKLFINPFLYWVQTLPEDFFMKYSNEIDYLYKNEIKKDNIDLDLITLELEAKQYTLDQ